MEAIIHQLADVQTVHIGAGTHVWQFTVILKDAKIGIGCNINCNCFVENDVVIGNQVTVKSGVQIWDGVTLEDYVFIGPNATFTNDYVPRSKVYPGKFERTLVKHGASIGANSTIIAGVTIGEYAFIGAGAVVTKDIPPHTVWYGNPARHKGYITKDAILLNLQLVDPLTGDQYVWQDNEIKK